MKKFLAWIAVVLILAGCEDSGGQAEDLQKLLANQCQFTAVVIADFGEMSYQFTLECLWEPEAAFSFSVSSPESIADICGTVSQGTGNIRFEDTVLTFPLLAQGELSPAIGPWLLLRAAKSGYLRCEEKLEDGSRLTYDDYFGEEKLQADLWVKDGDPCYGELLWQGRKVISVRIDGFRIV